MSRSELRLECLRMVLHAHNGPINGAAMLALVDVLFDWVNDGLPSPAQSYAKAEADQSERWRSICPAD